MKKNGDAKTLFTDVNGKVREPNSHGEFQDHFYRYLDIQAKVLANAHNCGEAPGEEWIHDMRVALRSLLSVCGSLKPWLDKSWFRDTIPMAKTATNMLGRVRDADVLLAHLKKYMDKPGGNAEGILLLESHIRGTRSNALAEMTDYFHSEQYCALLYSLQSRTACLPAIDENYKVVPSKMEEVWGVSAYGAAQSLLAYDAYLHGRDMPAELLHRMRVSFKRLRYLAEFFKYVSGKRGKHTVKVCIKCQDMLGKMHDSLVAGQTASKFKQSLAGTEREQIAPDISRYATYCDKKAVKYARTFLKYWRQEGKREIRKLLSNPS